MEIIANSGKFSEGLFSPSKNPEQTFLKFLFFSCNGMSQQSTPTKFHKSN